MTDNVRELPKPQPPPAKASEPVEPDSLRVNILKALGHLIGICFAVAAFGVAVLLTIAALRWAWSVAF